MNTRLWVVALLLVAFAAAIVGSTLHGVAFQAQADEGVYLHYATRIAQEGLPAFPGLFQDFLEHAANRQYFPSPLRLFTILLGAAAVFLGGPTFGSLQLLSLLSFLALLVLVFTQVRRAIDESAATWTTLLLAVSPLHLAMARRALADSLIATLLVASLCLLIRTWTAEKPKAAQWWAVSGAYLVTFLTKEGTTLLVPISLAFLGWRAIYQRRRPSLLSLCAVSLVPLVGALLLVSLAAGSFATAWRTLVLTVRSAQTNTYALQYGAGPWFRYLIDYLLLSPWTTLLYLMWLGVLVGARVRNEWVWAWALIPVLFLGLSSPVTKNVRYALVLETPMRLSAVLLIKHLADQKGKGRWALLKVALPILAFAWMDLVTFTRFFVTQGIYDPVSFVLLSAHRFLPK